MLRSKQNPKAGRTRRERRGPAGGSHPGAIGRTTTRLRTQIGRCIGDAARSVAEVAAGAGSIT